MTLHKLLYLFAISGIILVSCQKEPEASISADKTEAGVGEVINFKNSTLDGYSFEWDFGDGTSSNIKEPSKTYSDPGNYTVKMRAYSKNGKKSSQAYITISIIVSNQKYIGNYVGYFSSQGQANEPASLQITAGDKADEIKMTFSNGMENINATVDLVNIDIPSQQQVMQSPFTITYQGDGFLDSNEEDIQINLDYAVSDGTFTQSSSTVFFGSK